MKRNDDNIEEVLKHSLPSASKEQLDSARGRVYDYATSDATVVLDEGEIPLRRRFGWAWIPALTAAAVVIASIWVGARWQDREVYAVLETPSGSMYRLVDEKLAPVATGERIEVQDVIRSNGGSGGTLKLSDGSRVETRSQTELSIERTEDGIRIRLGRGGLIVNAAKQQAGQHLYVQTRDLTVSVVGTVFLVNAEEEGSRVAVIEGEVRVKQGAKEKKLGPGQQVATSPSMKLQPMSQGIAWSRQAEAHLAVLEQSTEQPHQNAAAPQVATESRLVFEVASIRPSNAIPTGGGARGNNTTLSGCSFGEIQIDPRRFLVTNLNAYTLITMAYATPGRDCQFFSLTDLLTGGPGWAKSDQFNVQATIPEGTPSYTESQFGRGESPEIQKMLQTLLADRFKLVLGRQIREMQAHALVLGKTKDATQLAELAAETIRRSPDILMSPTDGTAQVPRSTGQRSTGGGAATDLLPGRNASMGELAARLAALTGRPVVDQTGLTGRFTFDIQYEQVRDTIPGRQGFGRPLNSDSSASLYKALEEQLGLKLEATKTPTEVLVIERLEKPSEN
jgi:uncharacterized protein (TIGR03435 family)